jgi:hypothetical protein
MGSVGEQVSIQHCSQSQSLEKEEQDSGPGASGGFRHWQGPSNGKPRESQQSWRDRRSGTGSEFGARTRIQGSNNRLIEVSCPGCCLNGSTRSYSPRAEDDLNEGTDRCVAAVGRQRYSLLKARSVAQHVSYHLALATGLPTRPGQQAAWCNAGGLASVAGWCPNPLVSSGTRPIMTAYSCFRCAF